MLRPPCATQSRCERCGARRGVSLARSGLFIIVSAVLGIGVLYDAAVKFAHARPHLNRINRIMSSHRLSVADLSEGMNEAQMLVRVLATLETMQKSHSEDSIKTIVAKALKEQADMPTVLTNVALPGRQHGLRSKEDE